MSEVQSTHSEHCWKWHRECFMRMLGKAFESYVEATGQDEAWDVVEALTDRLWVWSHAQEVYDDAAFSAGSSTLEPGEDSSGDGGSTPPPPAKGWERYLDKTHRYSCDIVTGRLEHDGDGPWVLISAVEAALGVAAVASEERRVDARTETPALVDKCRGLRTEEGKAPKRLTEKLLPCPFCGGSVAFRSSEDGAPEIECEKCDYIYEETREQQIARWNTRPAEVTLRRQYEVMENEYNEIRSAIEESSMVTAYAGGVLRVFPRDNEAKDDDGLCDDCEAPLKGDDTFCKYCYTKPASDTRGLTPTEMLALPLRVRRFVMACAAEVAHHDEIHREWELACERVQAGNEIIAELRDKVETHGYTIRGLIKANEMVCAKLERREQGTYCAYCGFEVACDDEAGSKISEHVKTCSKHPMREIESKLAKCAEALVTAKETIHAWHGDIAWAEYQESPEMKQINDTLKEVQGG